jgi:lipoate-protein ligase A
VGPHVANLSLYTIKYREDTLEISELFADLARVLFPALAMFGITASYKRVAGAYCDGKYDIAVGGRKLGGTAGLTRAVRQMRAGIVHAAISLRDQAGDLSVVADFERNLGFDYNYRRGAMTSFSQEIASTASHIAA